MRLFRALWLTESLEHCRRKLLRQGKQGRLSPELYVIALPEKQNALLEILPAWQLREPHYREADPLIVGMAADREEALELSGGILGRVFHRTGAFDVASYVSEAEKELG